MDISDLTADDPITTIARMVAEFIGQFTDTPVSVGIGEARADLDNLIVPFSMLALGAVFAALAILLMLIALLPRKPGKRRGSRIGSTLALVAISCFAAAWISLWLDGSYDVDAVLGSFLLALLAVFAFLAWLLGGGRQRYLLWSTAILAALGALVGFSTWAFYAIQYHMGWM